MKFGMYSIRDFLTGYMTPVIEQSDAVALRNFEMACDRSSAHGSSLIAWRPDDFCLLKIAEFDNDSGKLTPIDPPEFIANGHSVPGRHGDHVRTT